METFLIRALQLILCFSILILLHEGGHFFFARLFKVRVEKFCLFFDPWKTILKFKPKNSETQYCLGWLPLGGYVKISGMIDESMDKAQMALPPQPWEFRSKPAWQRLLIMLGGVMVNFLLALIIYSMVLLAWGETYIPAQNMTMGMQFNSEAKALGFRDGDILLKTDKQAFRNFDTTDGLTSAYRALSQASVVTVSRQGKEVNINMPEEGLNLLEIIKANPIFAVPYVPSVIDSVLQGSAAHKAGVCNGDSIVSFNGLPVSSTADYNLQVRNLSISLKDAPTDDSLALRKVLVGIKHQGATAIDTVEIMLTEDLKMGVMLRTLYAYYQPVTKHYNVLSCIPAGVNHAVKTLEGYVADMKYVFTREGAESVGSFGAIGSMFPSSWNWHRFWELTAFISIILAFMNILPIPALDGGHVLFLLVEIITRRKPSEKFLEYAETIGMILLLLLMVWALRNDVVHFLL